jgi:biotin carboxyl carrier protein
MNAIQVTGSGSVAGNACTAKFTICDFGFTIGGQVARMILKGVSRPQLEIEVKLMKYITTIDNKEFEIEVVDEHHIRIGNRLLEVDFESVSGQPVFSLILDGKSYEAFVYQGDEDWEVLIRGQQYQVNVEDEREKRLKTSAGGGSMEGGEFHLKAPMPGLVVAILLEEGQEVKKGQVMMILESMKMQNELKAPRDGVIGRIRVKAGESVEQKQTLLSVQ